MSAGAAASPERRTALAHARTLEWFTIGWTLVEAAAGFVGAVPARSVALLAFAIDSLVESASGGVLLWRLAAERRHVDPEAIERLDRRAAHLVGGSLMLLAAYVVVHAAAALWWKEAPEATWIGIAVPAAAMVVMAALARAKRKAAAVLGSRSLEADAYQSSACFWLSAITLIGIALNWALGWWWADPLAALGMSVLIAREGREVWAGESSCGCHCAIDETRGGDPDRPRGRARVDSR